MGQSERTWKFFLVILLKGKDRIVYKYYNPNPEKNHVGDCVVRALTVAFDDTWDNAFVRLMAKAYELKDMPSSNSVWGSLLTDHGFKAYMAIQPCETLS